MTFKPFYVSIDECAGVNGFAVVIDVLRAFTTAAWAFHLGVERIVLSGSIDEALRLKDRLPGALALKDSKPMDGFELSNSPVELQKTAALAGKTIVQQTTHGTAGAVAAGHAETLLCASFVCASATARALRELGAERVYFVVTGEGGAAEEDRACAEYIAALVESPDTSAEPYLDRARCSSTAALLAQRIADHTPGVDPLDLDTCLQADVFDFAMRARREEGLLILRPYNRSDD